MGELFDVVSGKVYRFNQMREQAHKQVMAAIKVFLSTTLSTAYPKFTVCIPRLRPNLYMFFICANCRVDAFRKIHRCEETIRTANLRRYLCLLAELHGYAIVRQWRHEFPFPTVGIYALKEIYQQDEAFAFSWIETIKGTEQIADTNIPPHLGRHLYTRISPLLGLMPSDYAHAELWTNCVERICVESLVLSTRIEAASIEALIEDSIFPRVQDTLNAWIPLVERMLTAYR